MDYLHIILNIAMLLLALIFIYDLFKKIVISKNKLSDFKNVFKVLTIGFLIIFIPVFIMNNYVEEIALDTPEQQINFNKKYKHYLDLHRTYSHLMITKSDSLNLNYDYINSLKLFKNKRQENKKFDYEYFFKTNTHKNILQIYNGLFKSKDKDIPNLFLGLHFLNFKENKKAEDYLSKVKNQNLNYYNYVFGKFYFKTKDFIKAEEFLIKASKEEYIQQDALNELARLYYYFREEQKLEALVLANKNSPVLNTFFKRIVSFRTLNFVGYWKPIFNNEYKNFNLLGFGSALMILMIWLFYIRKVDVYEPESWLHTLFVLFFSMLTLFLVYPLSDILRDVFEYYSSSYSVLDFIHMLISIGFVEEFVKLIPVLALLKFTDAINEPFDYIYYFSISALGFAFIENIGYLEESSLYNINARALLAAVAHIVFSSTIGYGMMLAKYKKHKRPLVTLILFFILASFMHAFYDFWLINLNAKKYEWLTIIYFIISIHIWHVYANNTLNISTFYNDEIKIENDKIKYYVILSLIGVVMVSWLVNGYTQGQEYAADYLINSILHYGFFVFYLAFSLSRFEIIRGYLKPFSIPFRLLIPKVSNTEDYTNTIVQISPSSLFVQQEFIKIQEAFPVYGVLIKRVVIDDNLECYLMLLDNPIPIEGFINDMVLICPKSVNKKLNSEKKILVQILLISEVEILENQILTQEDFTLVGLAISQQKKSG